MGHKIIDSIFTERCVPAGLRMMEDSNPTQSCLLVMKSLHHISAMFFLSCTPACINICITIIHARGERDQYLEDHNQRSLLSHYISQSTGTQILSACIETKLHPNFFSFYKCFLMFPFKFLAFERGKKGLWTLRSMHPYGKGHEQQASSTSLLSH